MDICPVGTLEMWLSLLSAAATLFVTLADLDHGLLSDYKICGQSGCESPMSRVQAVRDHRGQDCRFLSFRRGDTIFVYHKLTGQRSDLWAGSIDKQFGYFPKDSVKEEQVYATTEKTGQTQKSDFFCMEEADYPTDSSHLDTDDVQKIQESETTRTNSLSADRNAGRPSSTSADVTESPVSPQEAERDKQDNGPAARPPEEEQETPVAVKEQGGSLSSSWFSSSVTGWFGPAKSEEAGTLAEGQTEASLMSSVTGWLGLGGTQKPDDSTESEPNEKKRTEEEEEAAGSVLIGWLSFGEEKRSSKEEEQDGEKDEENECGERFRSRKIAVDSDSFLEDRKQMGTLDWLGNGLSNRLGFQQESRDKASGTPQEEELQTSSSWFDLGFGNMLGFGKDTSGEENAIISDFKETEEDKSEDQRTELENVVSNLPGGAAREEVTMVEEAAAPTHREAKVLEDNVSCSPDKDTNTPEVGQSQQDQNLNPGSTGPVYEASDGDKENTSKVKENAVKLQEASRAAAGTSSRLDNVFQIFITERKVAAETDRDVHQTSAAKRENQGDDIKEGSTDQDSSGFSSVGGSGLSSVDSVLDITRQSVGDIKDDEDRFQSEKTESMKGESFEVMSQTEDADRSTNQHEASHAAHRTIQRPRTAGEKTFSSTQSEESAAERVVSSKRTSETSLSSSSTSEDSDKQHHSEAKGPETESNLPESDADGTPWSSRTNPEVPREHTSGQDTNTKNGDQASESDNRNHKEPAGSSDADVLTESGLKSTESETETKQPRRFDPNVETENRLNEGDGREAENNKNVGTVEDSAWTEDEAKNERSPEEEVEEEEEEEEVREMEEEEEVRETEEEVEEVRETEEEKEVEEVRETEEEKEVEEEEEEVEEEVREMEEEEEVRETEEEKEVEEVRETEEEVEEVRETEEEKEVEEVRETEEEVEEVRETEEEEDEEEEEEQAREKEEAREKEVREKEEEEKEAEEVRETEEECEESLSHYTKEREVKEKEQKVNGIKQERSGEDREEDSRLLNFKGEETVKEENEELVMRSEDEEDSSDQDMEEAENLEEKEEVAEQKEEKEEEYEEEVKHRPKTGPQIDRKQKETNQQGDGGASGDMNLKNGGSQSSTTEERESSDPPGGAVMSPDSSQVDLHKNSAFSVSNPTHTSSPRPTTSGFTNPEPNVKAKSTLTKRYQNLLDHMSVDETVVLIELFGRHKLQFLDYILDSRQTERSETDESIVMDIENLLHYHREALFAPHMRLADGPQEDPEKIRMLIALQKLDMLLAGVRETFGTGQSKLQEPRDNERRSPEEPSESLDKDKDGQQGGDSKTETGTGRDGSRQDGMKQIVPPGDQKDGLQAATRLLQVVSSLPDDIRPGPDLYGLPWEPVIFSSVVGLLTVLLFSCRCYRSVKSRVYRRKEGQMAEQVSQLLEEKCEVLQTLSRCQQEFDDLERSLKNNGVLAQMEKTEHLDVKARQMECSQTELERDCEQLKDQLDQQRAHRTQQEKKTTDLEKLMKTLEEETKDLQSQYEQAQTSLKVYSMNSDRLQKNLETAAEENEVLQQSNTQLHQQAEGWAERVSELEEEMRRCEVNHSRMLQDVANKDEHIMSLTERLLRMKAWVSDIDEEEGEEGGAEEAPNGRGRAGAGSHQQKVQKLIYAAKLNADLKSVDEDKDRVFARLNDEVRASEDLQGSSEQLKKERITLQSGTERYSDQVQRLQQKLHIMTEMYQENELKLHRLLTVEEKERLQKEEKLSKADRNITLAMEELNNYRRRAEDMEEELQKTKQSYQTQISAHEKKAHNNWLAARAADRELADIRRENALLRQKLTDTQFKLDALDKDPYALNSLARPLPFRGERSPFGPSPLGRPASETRQFLSPPTLMDGPPAQLSRGLRGPVEPPGGPGEMERSGGAHSDSGSNSPTWDRDRRGPPLGPSGPPPGPVGPPGPPGYMFPDAGGPIYRRPAPPSGPMGPLPPLVPLHPRVLPPIGAMGLPHPADMADGSFRENSLRPADLDHRESGLTDRRTPPEPDQRPGGRPMFGPMMGPVEGPFPRRAPYEALPPDFYPPRGPGGPPMMPMWPPPPPGMMLPPRYPPPGPRPPPPPHGPSYGPPIRLDSFPAPPGAPPPLAPPPSSLNEDKPQDAAQRLEST